MARHHAPHHPAKHPKTPPKQPKSTKKPLSRWFGYVTSFKVPKGPKMIMQHPLVAKRQSYVNIVDNKGRYMYQAIVVFPLGTPQPSHSPKLIELTGTGKNIRMRSRNPRTKGHGYGGTVIYVKHWRYAKGTSLTP